MNSPNPGPTVKPFIETRWADGLRGIASLFVVASHLCLCFSRSVIAPSVALDGPSKPFQLPFFRLIGQGNAPVAVFLVLLGFVNSLKAIQLSRSGCAQDAWSILAAGSFRRTGRLMFPAAVVTVISWICCETGLYSLSRRSDAFWLQSTTAPQSLSWWGALRSLGWELIATWVVGENKYDQPQWALTHLFKGSFYIYMVLLATANTTVAFRLTTEILLYAWGWIANDCIVRPNVFSGMILAELAFLPEPRSKSKLVTILPYGVVTLGLYLCSYPDRFADQARWSRQLEHIGLRIFPQGAWLGRFWPDVGAQLLCFGVMYSPPMRRALSRKWLQWLGGISYSIYLLHGTLMRTVLAWLVFGPNAIMGVTSPPGEDNQPSNIVPQPGDAMVAIRIPIFFAILLLVASTWNRKVEPYFGAATARLEKFARTFGKDIRLFNTISRTEGNILPISMRKD